MQGVRTMSSLNKDFLASYLRSQLTALQGVLDNIENSDRFEDGYLKESLRRIEKELHRLRKSYISN